MFGCNGVVSCDTFLCETCDSEWVRLHTKIYQIHRRLQNWDDYVYDKFSGRVSENYIGDIILNFKTRRRASGSFYERLCTKKPDAGSEFFKKPLRYYSKTFRDKQYSGRNRTILLLF